MLRLAPALLIFIAVFPTAHAQPCPIAADLPQLTIDSVEEPAIPVVDDWQILWDRVPLSDAQLALLAHDDPMIDITQKEMRARGPWVYVGMLTAAVGAAVSSVGWVLFGRNSSEVSQSVTLTMGLGGLFIGGSGVLLVSEYVQTPLEPHLAPTPRHRMSREEARRLVQIVNQSLFDRICKAAGEAGSKPAPPLSENRPAK